MKQTLTVNGMHCNACVMLITEALEDAGATNVSITLDPKSKQGTVTLESKLSNENIKTIIENEGEYTVA